MFADRHFSLSCSLWVNVTLLYEPTLPEETGEHDIHRSLYVCDEER